jgi:hypothetical protein
VGAPACGTDSRGSSAEVGAGADGSLDPAVAAAPLRALFGMDSVPARHPKRREGWKPAPATEACPLRAPSGRNCAPQRFPKRKPPPWTILATWDVVYHFRWHMDSWRDLSTDHMTYVEMVDWNTLGWSKDSVRLGSDEMVLAVLDAEEPPQ